jgi:hypothetical protein
MKKRDLILIGIVLAVALIALGILQLLKKDGAYVSVTVHGVEVATYSLEEDGEYVLNGGTNILKIENGEAWMIEADCPTLGSTRCTAQGKISKTTECIYCQPNEVLVTVYGAEMPDVELVS